MAKENYRVLEGKFERAVEDIMHKHNIKIFMLGGIDSQGEYRIFVLDANKMIRCTTPTPEEKMKAASTFIIEFLKIKEMVNEEVNDQIKKLTKLMNQMEELIRENPFDFDDNEDEKD